MRSSRKNPPLRIKFIAHVSLLALAAGCYAYAQSALPDAPQPQSMNPLPANPEVEVTVRNTPRNFLHDQAAIWTSPRHLRVGDLEWLVPLGAATGLALDTDQSAMTHVVSKNPVFNQDNVDASNVLLGSFIAAPVALFSLGHLRQDDHAREAGILSAEAMLDGVVVEQGMKLIFWQERPGVDNARGRFFQSSAGIDSSFPSAHGAIAWSAAAELAGEYPSHWTQFFLYSAATGVSLTRVLGQQHFPADVLVSGAAGWLIGHYVYRKHHKIWTE